MASGTATTAPTGSGEPCQIDCYNNYTPDEIVWGSRIREFRKQQNICSLNPCSAPLMACGDTHTITVWRPKSLQNVNVPKIYESKILPGSKIVDRSALTTKQYFSLLAEPKKLMFNPNVVKPVIRRPVPPTPRVLTLALPKKQTIVNTWLSYRHMLPKPRIELLLKLLNNDLAMNIPDAETLFKDVKQSTAGKKQQKKKRTKTVSAKQRCKANRRCFILHVLELAYLLTATYLLSGKGTRTNASQKAFANKLLSQLVERTILCCKPSRKSKNIYQRCLIQAADKAAIFVFAILQQVELSDLRFEDYVESTESSITEFTIPLIAESIYEGESEATTLSIMTGVFESMDGEAFQEFPQLSSFDHDHIAGRLRLIKLIREYYKNRSDLHDKTIFSDTNLPYQPTLTDTMRDIENIMCEEMLSKPMGRLTAAFERKISKWVREVDASQLDELMREDIYMLATELARRTLTTIIECVCSGTIQEPEYFVPGKPSVTIETVISVPSSSSESLSQICASYLKQLKMQEITICKDLDITPHTPGMVCCASLKVWANWIKEVAENAKMWCLWINQVIKQMRYIAAIMRGEVLDRDGCPIRMKRDEWYEFVNRLKGDVKCWHSYNEHVQRLSSQIIEHFHNKPVECCWLCKEENINISEVGIEHLCEQLMEATQTTECWRRWLHNMVNEAQTLTQLGDTEDVEITTIQEISSSTAMLAIAGAQIIQTRSSDTSKSSSRGEPSIYSIELIDPNDVNKPPC